MRALTLEQFNKKLCEVLGGFCADPTPDQEEVDLGFDAFRWSGITVAYVSCNVDKIRLERCGRDASDESRNQLIVLYRQIQGQTFVDHVGKESLLRPGDFALIDTTKAAVLSFDEHPVKFSGVCFPRTEFLSVRQDAINVGSVLSGQSPGGRAVASVLPSCDADGQTDFVFDLVRAAFMPQGQNHEDAKAPENAIRYHRLLDLIDLNLRDPEFRIATLCDRARISIRQVQREFEARGESFSHLLTTRRLELAEQRLRRARETGVLPNIGRIAMASGFGDISNFNRVFKRNYGCTPSEYLAHVSSGPHLD